MYITSLGADDLTIFRTSLSLLNTLDEKTSLFAHEAMTGLAPVLVARLMDVLVGVCCTPCLSASSVAHGFLAMRTALQRVQ